MKTLSRLVLVASFLLSVGSLLFSKSEIRSRSGIRVILNGAGQSFQIKDSRTNWTIQGSVEGSISDEHTLKGNDTLGSFAEIVFVAASDISFRCTIRSYNLRPVVLFEQEALDSLAHLPKAFPVLSKFPSDLDLMTFSEREFGAPTIFRRFGNPSDSVRRDHSGPVVLYDSRCNACIVSPSLHFMVASTVEDGASVRCGLNSELTGVPRGFTQSTILVLEPGINRAWDTWGRTLTALHHKHSPTNDADAGLKYLGYWTDNGATYYYHYDTTKGYDGTLLALKKRYDEDRIPIRSLQLDSWWYPKGYDNPDGSVDRTEKRIANLPAGSWNRFGGLLQYVPSPELFPAGLRQFHDSLRLALITHNRWISRESAYRNNYRISGIGAIDSLWWDKIMRSISSWGVITYEQDWLDRIYKNSPEFSSTTWAGEAFMDDMATAARNHGLTLQYCMAMPRHYLQGGSNYSNLTSIRVSGDRFQKDRWKEFLYASRMAGALGVWPWTDVFMSKETPNILLATLSAGMVGIGDAIGDEDIVNIMRSVRADGVIVKPDLPLVPIDRSYIDDGNEKGLRIASTHTDHGESLRTVYLFAYADSDNCTGVNVAASDVGIKEKMFVYDYFSATGKVVTPNDSIMLDFRRESYCYDVLAPIGRTGIAFIGDNGKFVTCGKKRIGQLVETKDGLKATILMAKGEQSVTICGYAPKMPQFLVHGGSLENSSYNRASHIFSLVLKPQENLNYRVEHGDAVGKIVLEFKKHP